MQQAIILVNMLEFWSIIFVKKKQKKSPSVSGCRLCPRPHLLFTLTTF